MWLFVEKGSTSTKKQTLKQIPSSTTCRLLCCTVLRCTITVLPLCCVVSVNSQVYECSACFTPSVVNLRLLLPVSSWTPVQNTVHHLEIKVGSVLRIAHPLEFLWRTGWISDLAFCLRFGVNLSVRQSEMVRAWRWKVCVINFEECKMIDRIRLRHHHRFVVVPETIDCQGLDFATQ